MKNIPLALLFLACSGAAVAGIWSNAMPPQRFRLPASALVKIVPAHEVQAACAIKPPTDGHIVACAVDLANTGLIVLPDPCPFAEDGEYFARIACHEFAHVSGWSGEHPE